MAPIDGTVLLVCDIQHGIAERYEHTGALEGAAAAVATARGAGVPVVFVRVAFRDGHPEVAASNRMFSALRDGGALTEAASSIHPEVAPEPGEVVVTKRRVSAFAGSDLDVVLRALGARHLVVCGFSTSGVVLSTVRAAADLDFELTVLRDACADADPEVHALLLDRVFPRQADVMDVAAWTQRIMPADA